MRRGFEQKIYKIIMSAWDTCGKVDERTTMSISECAKKIAKTHKDGERERKHLELMSKIHEE